jgi:hypothetical protein
LRIIEMTPGWRGLCGVLRGVEAVQPAIGLIFVPTFATITADKVLDKARDKD